MGRSGCMEDCAAMTEKRKKEYVWFVEHPEHTTVPVIAESWEQATVYGQAPCPEPAQEQGGSCSRC